MALHAGKRNITKIIALVFAALIAVGGGAVAAQHLINQEMESQAAGTGNIHVTSNGIIYNEDNILAGGGWRSHNEFSSYEWGIDPVNRTLVIRPNSNAQEWGSSYITGPTRYDSTFTWPWQANEFQNSYDYLVVEKYGDIPVTVSNTATKMFKGTNIKKFDISGLSFAADTDYYSLEEMFADCESLETIDSAVPIDLNGVKNLYHMFYSCSGLESVVFKAVNTSNVTNMGSMFQNCGSLKTVKFDMSDTSKVTEYNAMFVGCASLQYVDLSCLDTSSATSTDLATTTRMTNLKTMVLGEKSKISFGSFGYYNTPNIQNYQWVRDEDGTVCSSSSAFKTKIDSGKDIAGTWRYTTQMYVDAYSSDGSFSVDLSEYTATPIYLLFHTNEAPDTYVFDDGEMKHIGAIRSNPKSITRFDEFNPEGDSESFWTKVFQETIGDDFNTNNLMLAKMAVRQMSFDIPDGLALIVGESAENLFSLMNMEKFDGKFLDVKNTKNFSSCFSSANIKEIDISTWDTPSGTNFSMMFYGCDSTKTIDARKLSLANAPATSSMFQPASTPSLTKLIVGEGWKYWNQTDTRYPTLRCDYGDGTSWWYNARTPNEKILDANDVSSEEAVRDYIENYDWANNNALELIFSEPQIPTYAIVTQDSSRYYLRFASLSSEPQSGQTYVDANGNQTQETILSVYPAAGDGNNKPAWIDYDENDISEAAKLPWSADITSDAGKASRWAIIFESPVAPKTTKFWFRGMKIDSANCDFSQLDTSNVTSMESMFSNAGVTDETSFPDFSGWDTSNVKSVKNMFYWWQSKTIDTGALDFSNVEDFSGFAQDAYSVTKVVVGKPWSGSSPVGRKFSKIVGTWENSELPALKELDLSGIGIDWKWIYADADGEDRPGSAFNGIFGGYLTGLDTVSFGYGWTAGESDNAKLDTHPMKYSTMIAPGHYADTDGFWYVTGMQDYNNYTSSQLASAIRSHTSASDPKITFATKMDKSFGYAMYNTSGDINAGNLHLVFFSGENVPTTVKSADGSQEKLVEGSQVLNVGKAILSDSKSWDANERENSVYGLGNEAVFDHAKSVTAISIVSPDGNKVVLPTAIAMFSKFESAVTIDGLENLDTSGVDSIQFMFDRCFALKNLDLSSLDISNVTDARDFMEHCDAMERITVSGSWNVVKNMNSGNTSGMFPVNLTWSVEGDNAHTNMTGDQVIEYLGALSSDQTVTLVVHEPEPPIYFIWTCEDSTNPTFYGLHFVKTNTAPSIMTNYVDADGNVTNELVNGIGRIDGDNGLLNATAEEIANDISNYVPWTDYAASNSSTPWHVTFECDVAPISTTAYWFQNMTIDMAHSDFTQLDTSNVENMRNMFCYANLKNADDVYPWNSFDTSKVKTVNGMFGYYKGDKIDTSMLDFSNVEDFSGFAAGAWNAKSVSVGKPWSGASPKGTNFVNMLSDGESMERFEEIDVSGIGVNWDAIGENTVFWSAVPSLGSVSKVSYGLGWIIGENSNSDWTQMDTREDWYAYTPEPGYNTDTDGFWYRVSDPNNTSYAREDIVSVLREEAIAGQRTTFYTKNEPIYSYVVSLRNPNNAADSVIVFDKFGKSGPKNTYELDGVIYNVEQYWFGGDDETIGWENAPDTSIDDAIRRPWLQCDMTRVIAKAPVSPLCMANWFSIGRDITYDLNEIDTSKVTDMSGMFAYSSVKELDLSNWDTSSVTNMYTMFWGAFYLESLDVSGWDTSNVTNMTMMFSENNGLESIDLSHFTSESLEEITSMFAYSNFKHIDISGFDVTEVSVDDIFNNLSSLESFTINKTWSKLPNTNQLYRAFNLTSEGAPDTVNKIWYVKGDSNSPAIPTANLDAYMSLYNSNDPITFTTEKPAGKFALYGNDADGYVMVFYNGTQNETPQEYYCAEDGKTRQYVEGTDFFDYESYVNTGYAENQYFTFGRIYDNELGRAFTDLQRNIKYVDFGVELGNSCKMPKTLSHMFEWFSGLEKILNIENMDTSDTVDMSSMFVQCHSLAEIDLSALDTSKVEDTGAMFQQAYGLKNITMGSAFSSGALKNTWGMFSDAENLTEIDVSRMNMSNVVTMPAMFSGCKSLENLDVSSFDTRSATSMYSMFEGCEKLSSLDVSHFDVSKVTDMASMFKGCASLSEIDVTNFKIAAGANLNSMFANSGIISLDLGKWDMTESYMHGYCGGMFDGMSQLRSITVNRTVDSYSPNCFFMDTKLPMPPNASPYDGGWHLYVAGDASKKPHSISEMDAYMSAISPTDSTPVKWVWSAPLMHTFIPADGSANVIAPLLELVERAKTQSGEIRLEFSETLAPTESLVFDATTEVTLNLNGHVLNSDNRPGGTSLIQVSNGAKVTITDAAESPTSKQTGVEPSTTTADRSTYPSFENGVLKYIEAPLSTLATGGSTVKETIPTIRQMSVDLSNVGAITVSTASDASEVANAVEVGASGEVTLSRGRITANGRAVLVSGSEAKFNGEGGFLVGSHTTLAPAGVAIGATSAGATVALDKTLVAVNEYTRNDAIDGSSFLSAPARLGVVSITHRARFTATSNTHIVSNYQKDPNSMESVAGLYIGGDTTLGDVKAHSNINGALISCNVSSGSAGYLLNEETMEPLESAMNAGGMAVYGGGIDVTLDKNTAITHNVSNGVGGGISLNADRTDMKNCYVIANTARGNRQSLSGSGETVSPDTGSVETKDAKMSDTVGSGVFIGGGITAFGTSPITSLTDKPTVAIKHNNVSGEGFGGLGIEKDINVMVTGLVKVTDNTSGIGAVAPSNMYLNDDAIFNVCGPLDPSTSIGVTLQEAPQRPAPLRKAFAQQRETFATLNMGKIYDSENFGESSAKSMLDSMTDRFSYDDENAHLVVKTLPEYGQYIFEVANLTADDLYGKEEPAPDDSLVVQYYAWVESASPISTGNKIAMANTPAKDPVNGLGTNNNPLSGVKLESLNITEDGTVRTEQALTQIFQERAVRMPEIQSSDRFISHYDKFGTISSEGYMTDQIWVLKSNKNGAVHNRNSTNTDDWIIYYNYDRKTPFTLRYDKNADDRNEAMDGNGDTIFYNADTVIRFVADPFAQRKVFAANFYDYDITDGNVYASAKDAYNRTNPMSAEAIAKADADPSKTLYVNTLSRGINTGLKAGSANVFAFGNANTGTKLDTSLWQGQTPNRYNRNSFAGCTFNLVKNELDDETKLPVYNGITGPELFGDATAVGKTAFTNDEYSLIFQNIGNVYTLEQVRQTKEIDGEQKEIVAASDLNTFHNPGVYNGKNGKALIWTNNFWPMDKSDTFGAEGHDLKFGDDTKLSQRRHVSGQTNDKSANFPPSDDGAIDHNSYFGMDFDVSFQLDNDYCGPLSFFFYGDDDMWVFLDGKKICDLGGTHSSAGYYVDLWNYLDKPDSNATTSNASSEESQLQTHTMSIFYDERGSSGSSCWIQMVLPNLSVTEWNNKLDFKKVDEEGQFLEGAEFAIYKDSIGDGSDGAQGKDIIAIAASDENGDVHFEKLPTGTFYMAELKAPDGYEVTGEVYEVTIDSVRAAEIKVANGKNSQYLSGNVSEGYTIKNKKEPIKISLPLTGSIGIGMFVIAGLVLVACGGSLMMRGALPGRRKQGKQARGAAGMSAPSNASNFHTSYVSQNVPVTHDASNMPVRAATAGTVHASGAASTTVTSPANVPGAPPPPLGSSGRRIEPPDGEAS